MIIIDNKKDLANLSLAGDVILIPIYQNYKVHLKFNNVIILYILQLSDKKEWLIVTNRHNESLSNITKIKINDFNGIKYVIDKRELLYSINNLSDVVCLSTLYFLKFNKKLNIDLTNTPLHKFYSTKYSTFKDINMVIPLYKHYELCSRLSAVLVRIIRLCDVYNPEFKFFNDIAIPAFRILEENGLKIDKSKINPQFISKLKEYNKSDYIYSNYSFNTATGRPSNTFNKINFAALNKKDGTREAIISRFKNGMLLEYDYAAYHLQLISEVINFKLPADKDFHKYMAQQYFNKSNVSTDEIKKGKSITFRLLYGGVTKEYEHIDFYKQLQPIINAL
jgi:hypothetical protein